MNEYAYFYTSVPNIVFILKMFFISIATYYTSLKILREKDIFGFYGVLKSIMLIAVSSIICSIVKNITSYVFSVFFVILVLSNWISRSKNKNIGYSIITTLVSLSINYVIYFISLIISFFPIYAFNINNDYISLLTIIIIHIILLFYFFKIKRFKNGITFIQNKVSNEYCDILILNISVIIVFVMCILNDLDYINKSLALNFVYSFILFSIIMFITIQKTLTMYYKHKMLIKDLNETKEELENTKKDRDNLEQENIRISKNSHSISHKIKSLNRKIDKLMMNSEIANEIDIKDRIEKISKEYSKEKAIAEISKTEIEIIDDMLECMRDECIENNIEFELQLSGNIHYMTNNFIPKDELEILLADHIKDAIIAIQHTENINRSILVRLGLIDEFYSLYIYDSGIEFEIDTLVNLGTKAITTHPDEGGTGMGFLNTFDTLEKHNASMIIDEIGKPSKDNYTKVVMIRFDNKNEFKIKSYRSEEIKSANINNDAELI